MIAVGKAAFARSQIALAAALLAAALSACGILPERQPPAQLYTLTPKNTFDPSLPTVEWQLIVEVPYAAAGLNTPRIAVLREITKLEYFAGVQWSDLAPIMVQTLIVESFENSGKIVAVGREDIGLRANYQLKTELREFEALFDPDGRPQEAWVRIAAKLVKMPERIIIASQTFDSREPTPSADMAGVIVAFDDALGVVLKDIVQWTLTSPPPALSVQPSRAE